MKAFALAIALALAGTGCTKLTEEDVATTQRKYGCVATNEFVGKDAERLYMCSDGLKYKYWSIRMWALEEKRAQ